MIDMPYCPRCERDWDACKCLRLTADERRRFDAQRREKQAIAAAEWEAVQNRGSELKETT